MTIEVVNTPLFQPHVDRMHFSQAVKAGGLLFCSGMVGIGADGKVPDDLATEFHAAFKGIIAVLKEAGLTMADIVEMTTYHVDMQETIATFAAVRDEYLSAPWCAWSAIGTTGLFMKDAHVEIKVVAQAE